MRRLFVIRTALSALKLCLIKSHVSNVVKINTKASVTEMMVTMNNKDFYEEEKQRILSKFSIDELKRLIANPKCGDCGKWMISSCPKERRSHGYSYGPSCSDYPCDEFVDKWTIGIYKECLTIKQLNNV